MKIVSNEDQFIYDLSVGVKNKEYYKVSLINNISGNEQIIIKNDDGVYVITPSNNKSFKFTSNWPSNSSQAYLIESLLNDVLNDDTSVIEEKDNGYVIKAKVNYPNNDKLVSEEIYLDNNYNVTKVCVKDKDNNDVIIIEISNIEYDKKFDKDYFDINNYLNEDSTSECSGEDCNVSSILDDIIYPLYVPSDTYLSSKDTVDTSSGNRVILTFAGVNPFILVEEVSSKSDDMEIIPVNGEPLFLSSSIAALSNNSLYWTNNGVDFYLTSNTLTSSEMMTIAESIDNGTSLVSNLK